MGTTRAGVIIYAAGVTIEYGFYSSLDSVTGQQTFGVYATSGASSQVLAVAAMDTLKPFSEWTMADVGSVLGLLSQVTAVAAGYTLSVDPEPTVTGITGSIDASIQYKGTLAPGPGLWLDLGISAPLHTNADDFFAVGGLRAGVLLGTSVAPFRFGTGANFTGSLEMLSFGGASGGDVDKIVVSANSANSSDPLFSLLPVDYLDLDAREMLAVESSDFDFGDGLANLIPQGGTNFNYAIGNETTATQWGYTDESGNFVSGVEHIDGTSAISIYYGSDQNPWSAQTQYYGAFGDLVSREVYLNDGTSIIEQGQGTQDSGAFDGELPGLSNENDDPIGDPTSGWETTVRRPSRPTASADPEQPALITGSQVGSIFGSSIGQAIAGDNVFAQIAAGSALSAVLGNVGQGFDIYFVSAKTTPSVIRCSKLRELVFIRIARTVWKLAGSAPSNATGCNMSKPAGLAALR